MRGLKNKNVRKLLVKILSFIPGKGDYLKTTPYCLHFGWYHQKQPFYEFSERTWNALKKEKFGDLLEDKNRLVENL